MAVIAIKTYKSHYLDKRIPQTCWLGIEINLHPGRDPWCCNGPGPVGTGVSHCHRYFGKRTLLRSPR